MVVILFFKMKRFVMKMNESAQWNIRNFRVPKGLAFIFPFFLKTVFLLVRVFCWLFVYVRYVLSIYWTNKRIKQFAFFAILFGGSVNRPPMHLPINKTIPFIALNFLWHIRIKSHFIMSGIFMLWFYFILFIFYSVPQPLCDVKIKKHQIYGWIATQEKKW